MKELTDRIQELTERAAECEQTLVDLKL